MTFKNMNEKYRPYYFFSGMFNIKNFDLNLSSIDKASFKSIGAVTNYIKYITMKSLDHVNMDCENFLYLVFNNVDVYIIEENNENKYLNFFILHTRTRKYQKMYKKLWKIKMGINN